jgi:hypothetical protein
MNSLKKNEEILFNFEYVIGEINEISLIENSFYLN